ncbi:MAG TPA: glucose-1-phosphate adenylyltransferase [Clostridiales bacterium]|nr:glucose-1-phosphate adenylyltransferase [Clostridiales bacterium]
MIGKECVAMLLAGGQGSRLGVLTKNIAKPAVPFGGKYRIIDFPLSNCTNSGIDTVGVLTQYRPLKLNSYIGIGQPWDLDRLNGGVTILSPYVKQKIGEWYSGTANAIYQNIEYVDTYKPDYVLILSGDQIYKMDYSMMLEYHKGKNASVTVAYIKVPIEEAGRFGIMNTNEDGQIEKFDEKPKEPKSDKASMGIYIFNWKILKQYLMEDQLIPDSDNDFGKDILPRMLENHERMYAYQFDGYWKDVGTIPSFWEANMDLLNDPPQPDLYDNQWRIYSRNPIKPPHYISEDASVSRCIITEGCEIYGDVSHSVVFAGVHVGKGSKIIDSILMPGVKIGENTVIQNAIIAEEATIGDNCYIGYGNEDINQCAPEIYRSGITVIGEGVTIPDGVKIGKNVMVDKSILEKMNVQSGQCVLEEDF